MGLNKDLQAIVKQEKPKFVTQEALASDKNLKTFLIVFLAIFVLIDPIIATFIPIPINGKHHWFSPVFLFIGPCVVVILYGITHLDYFRKLFCLTTRISYFLNCFAILCFGVHLILQQSTVVEDALKSNATNDWIEAYISLSYSLFIVLLFVFLAPLWYLKSFMGICYILGAAIGFIRSDHPGLLWMVIRSIVSSFYLLALMWLKDKFRWKLYVKSLESEAWNQVHKEILDRNPSLIAVLNPEGEIIYSNDRFNEMSKTYEKQLFKQVTHLKKRSLNGACYTENVTMINEIKQTMNIEENGPESPLNRLKTQEIPIFENLELLLNHYLTISNKEDLVKEDQIIFEGKILKNSKQNTTLTFEIIIRYLVQYNKIVLTLNNTTLRDMLLTMESVNEYKDKLLASISHELRTPLHGNLSFLQAALSDKSIPIHIKDSLLLPALRSGKLLLHLINDILDYSQLQSHKILLQFESRSLTETLKYCLHLLHQAFDAKGIKLSLNVDPKIAQIVNTDHDRLIQILLNLLSNALKFTMKGSVHLHAIFISTDEIEIKVKDTGMGISTDDLNGLFEEKASHEELFFEGRKQKNSMGVGLGLKISHRLAKELSLHRDGLKVESKDGKGSVFSFIIVNKSEVLPTDSQSKSLHDSLQKEIENEESFQDKSLSNVPGEYDEEGRPPKIEIQSDKISTHHKLWDRQSYHCTQGELEPKKEKRVLIVDDEPFNVLALKSLLSQFNLSVYSACNGQEALEKVNNLGVYDLIFMDCQMPIMDGYETTLALMKKMSIGDIPEIPIIGCTAFSAKEKLEKCLQCGMKEVVTKPLMKEKIKQLIKKYLD